MNDTLPANPEIERLVLGAILQDGVMDAMRSTVDEADFHLESHRRIWVSMCSVYDRGTALDRISLYGELDRVGHAQAIGGLSYLVGLDDGLPRSINIGSYVETLKDKALLRRIVKIAGAIQNRCMLGEETGDEIHSRLAAEVMALADSGPENNRPVSTRDLIDKIGVSSLLATRRNSGVRLPWSRLNDALCGLHSGQMVVLAAYTGRGKTSAALQIATHVTRQSSSAIYWTLEMEPRALFRRIVNQLTGAPGDRVGHGALTLQEKQCESDAVTWLYDHPLYFDSHSRTIPSFCASIRQVRAKHEVALAVVDYLQLVRYAGRAESRTREVGENSRSLKLAALDFGIPFLVLSQFRRPASDKDATIHDLKESGDIENDSDVILLMNSAELSGNQDAHVKLHVGKQREGPAGFDIPMIFSPPSQTFTSPEE